ncbi:MAG: hypothetical protein ACYC4L_09835 [Chloroflexota bacterium]
MGMQQVNRISSIGLIVMSLSALLLVLSALTQAPQPPPPDEGAKARLFQMIVVALVPVSFLFLATADWRRPWRSARPLAFAAATTVLAFVILFYLEQYWVIR